MDPFSNNPIDPFGDPGDDVLSLQSYSAAAAGADCVSSVSCNSECSCLSDLSNSKGGPDTGATIATIAG